MARIGAIATISFFVAPADDYIVKYLGAVIAQLVRQFDENN